MAWVDDEFTDPESIYLLYQQGGFSDIAGEVDKEPLQVVAPPPVIIPPTTPFPPYCFAGNTPFIFFEGDSVTFEELYTNSEYYTLARRALSFDDDGNPAAGLIVKVMRSKTQGFWRVTFSDGETFDVKKEHRFFDEHGKYTPLYELGDRAVVSADGALAYLMKIEIIEEEIDVYNCTIAAFENYTVGRTKKRVHNNKPAPLPQGPPDF